MLNLLLKATLFLLAVGAAITNKSVKRQVRLNEAGSSLVTFVNDITVSKDDDDTDYYYVVAQDYMWSFVDLQVIIQDSLNQGKVMELEWERVNNLPANLLGSNFTALEANVQAFKIKLPNDGGDTQRFAVKEYHKGRMEPYPKVIRVFEKQKVEVFDNKFYLSVYSTETSTVVYMIN
jgi:hypothetical protein